MRVLHIIPAVSSRYGGPSRVILSLCESLLSSGVHVDIAATDADGDQKFQIEQWNSPVPLKLFETTEGALFRTSATLNRWLNKNIKAYDLIHSHSVWNDPVHTACSIARRDNVPYVYRPCGMLSEYSWSRGRLKKLAYWWIRERANVRGSAAIHCTSEDEQVEAWRCGATSAQTVIIPNGVDEEGMLQPHQREKLRTTWSSRIGQKVVLLFLSRLHPKKGLTDFLLPALVTMKDHVHLMIVGGEDDHAPGYRIEVEKMIGELGLQDNCDLIGPISPAERWGYFDAADLFVLPSHSENFGIVVAEAMARRCPVLITHGVQMHPHVTFAGAGLVVEPTVLAVQSGLKELVTNSEARTLFGVSGQIYAQAKFTWRQTAHEVHDLYKKILKRSSR